MSQALKTRTIDTIYSMRSKSTRTKRKVRDTQFLYESDFKETVRSTPKSKYEDLNKAKVKLLFNKYGFDEDVQIDYTCGNITIKCKERNLSQLWIDSLNKVFADSVFSWTVRDASVGKPFMHRAEIPYNGKAVYINIYTSTGTVLIQGSGYLEWMSSYGEQILRMVKGGTTQSGGTMVAGAHSTPNIHSTSQPAHDTRIEDLDKILGSPILKSCLDLFDDFSLQKHKTHQNSCSTAHDTRICAADSEDAGNRDKYVYSGIHTLVHTRDLEGLTQDSEYDLRCLQKNLFQKTEELESLKSHVQTLKMKVTELQLKLSVQAEPQKLKEMGTQTVPETQPRPAAAAWSKKADKLPKTIRVDDPVHTSTHKSPEATVLLIGNSNVRGLASKLKSKNREIRAESIVYSGGTIQNITSRIPHIGKDGDRHDFVVLHAGDISVRESDARCIIDMDELINVSRKCMPGSAFILPSVTTTKKNKTLDGNINRFNRYLQHISSKSADLIFLDIGDLPLLDSIHITAKGKDQYVEKIIRAVGKCRNSSVTDHMLSLD